MTTTRSRLGSLLAVTALLGALTGCGGDGDTEAIASTPTATASTSASASASPSASATPTAPALTADPETGRLDYCKDQKPFTGAAADEFGAEKVGNAYCTFITLMMEESFVRSHMISKGTDLKPIDFSVWEDYMTAETKADWQKAVKEVTSPGASDQARSNVWSLSYFEAVEGAGYEFTDEPVVLNQSFTPAQTEVKEDDGEKTLNMFFKISADLNVVKEGTDGPYYLVPTTKSVGLALVENPTSTSVEDQWLIDGFSAEFDLKAPYKRPALGVKQK